MPTEHAGLRLDQSLARLLPEHSRNRLQSWLREGRVRIDGNVRDPKDKVWGGERLLVAEAEAVAPDEDRAEAIGLNVVYEDAHIVVIDKPAGLVVHPGSGVPSGTLLNALLHHAPRVAEVPRAGIVHRLDKDTSGLLVLAKHAAAQEHLAAQFRRHDLHRAYLGLVYGVPRWQTQHLDTLHGRDPADRRRFSPAVGTRRAITDAAVVELLHGAAVVRFELHTGRTHQIRMHARQLGHPILGDVLYGHVPADPRVAAAVVGLGRHALHAAELAIVHPDGRRLSWRSALPAELAAVVAALRDGPPR